MAPGLNPREPAPGDADWSAPWLTPLRERAEPLARQLLAGRPVWQVLDEAARAHHAPVRFVPQQALPPGQAYEAYIRAQGAVPTREGWHDFLNGLIWLHFPATKRRLNELQSQVIAERGVGAVRGPLRDACTLLDENALLLQVPDELWDALCARDWRRLFVDLRPLWGSQGAERGADAPRVRILGHALLEKLLRPRKDLTAHVLRVPQGVAPAAFDGWLAQTLTPEFLTEKPFQPLPVLGIPGWWAPNEDVRFYDDTGVFRPLRKPVD